METATDEAEHVSLYETAKQLYMIKDVNRDLKSKLIISENLKQSKDEND